MENSGSERNPEISDIKYVLEMRNITKRFPGVIALDHVNLMVRPGKVHVICGENGDWEIDSDEGDQRYLCR